MAGNFGAGLLRDRVRFETRGTVDDGYGNEVPGGDWELQFTVWAQLMPLRGSETVIAARLQGQQPYIVRVRASDNTRLATPAWRIVFDRDPTRVLAITAPATDPDNKRAWLEFLVTEGRES